MLIVDYDVGNIASLINIFDHIGIEARSSGDPDEIRSCDRLVLPGVGAFDKAIGKLQDRGLVEPILEAALVRRVPMLGICLGMQLLARSSEEGVLPGLGLIDGDVVRIPTDTGVKVPHMGWSMLRSSGASPLFAGRDEEERFYFVHSYHMRCADSADVAATVHYGTELCVAVSRGNVHGVQFHPEKSHRFGMRLLRTFADIR